jgi:hypothetical protein
MRTGVELTRSQKEKEQREESKAESPPTDAPKPKELERRPVLALALVSFAGCALLASAAVIVAWACTEGDDGYEGHHLDDY